MTRRLLLSVLAILATGALVWYILTPRMHTFTLPGAESPPRRLLRIWVCSAVGGGESWLRDALRDWEKQHPNVMTFLRTVSPKDVADPDAVLPDVLLYTPGDFTAPWEYFVPVTGIEGLREEVLRAGRSRGEQYGVPLCYGGYALCIDASAEPHLAVTPAPTTLLGRPAATALPDASPTPSVPDDLPVLAPKGCGLFTLKLMADPSPALAQDFATLTPGEVFVRFKARQVSAAVLTTGQIASISGVQPVRVLTPGEVITDQLWLASIFPKADETAAQLLRYLTDPAAQRGLTAQSLHTVREDLRLYATGTEAAMESAARRLTVVNAYVPQADAEAAAWQVFQGTQTFDNALLPLL